MPLTDNEIEQLAQACHELNRHYCQTLGDHSQPPWSEAPEWQRESARDGVRFIEANPDASDSASHDNWMKVKKAEGWVFGAVKDPENKTHPCMVHYEALPVSQRFKDRLFRTLVRTALQIRNNDEV